MKRYAWLKNFIAYYIAAFLFELLFYELHERFLAKIDFFDRNYVVNKIYVVLIIALFFLAPLQDSTETEASSLEAAQTVLSSKWKQPFWVVFYLIAIYFVCYWLARIPLLSAWFSALEFHVDFIQTLQLAGGFLFVYTFAVVLSDYCYPLVVIMAKHIWRKNY